MSDKLTFRRYADNDHTWKRWTDDIFNEDTSYKCPTYVHRTPPCQGSCPSGEDIRGWLQIVRGIEKPPAGMSWQEYAFRRSTDANPFPAIMGRVCPAPCQEGCNRNEVEDFVGINSVEQFIGDHALATQLAFARPAQETGKKVAIIGGGVAGLAAAYQLRRLGHGATLFDERKELGGMTRYGIPGYRMPRDVMDGEIRRILDMGVEVRMQTRVGRDISFEQLEKDNDAILLAIGAQQGRTLNIPGGDAPNCVSGVAFLSAFNEGRMHFAARRVVVIGGGDTAMDVVSVARRLGHISATHENDRPEAVIRNHTAHDVAATASREGSEVLLIYRRPIEHMPAAEHERFTAKKEGIELRGNLLPVELVLDADGRAKALRVIEVDWNSGKMVEKPGTEFDIECDLVVPAVGQSGDMTGLERFDNGRGLIDADAFFQLPDKPGYFACGDIVRPHLLTTAIGQAAVTVDSIDRYLRQTGAARRPKVDVHHFNLLEKLRESALAPAEYPHIQEWGTDSATYAVHNYEDRSQSEIIPHEMLYLGHFPFTPRNRRSETGVGADEVLGHFEERFRGLDERQVQAEAGRCMSCGMCFECDNCVIYCPQDAVKRTPKDHATMGRYVYTDYDRCIGCHICAEVCPTGYINMGMGA